MQPTKAKPNYWKMARNQGAAFLAATLVLSIVVFLAQDFRQQMRILGAAASDNEIWMLAQTEVEAVKFGIIIEREIYKAEPDLSKIRLQFDILYSRAETVFISPMYASVRSNEELQTHLIAVKDFLQTFTPMVDADDATLKAGLPSLLAAVNELDDNVHALAVVSAHEYVSVHAGNRIALMKTITRLALVAVALILVLAGSVFALMRLNRTMRRTSLAQRLTRIRLESIVNTSLDAIVVTNAKDTIIEFNPAAEAVFGYDRSEAIGHEMADLLVPEKFKAAHAAGVARFKRTGDPHVIGKGIVQLEAKRKDGTVIPVDVALATAETESGTIYVSFLRDISKRVANETALREARDRAIAGERSKADLLAVMSHEMRTPLNGLLGTLELVETETLPPKHQRYCKIIRQSGQILLGHVNDVLDISRLDVGKVKLNKRKFDLIELLNDTLESQRSRAELHDTKLVLAPHHPALHEVYSDPERIQQVVLNLVGNAIKFTRNGSITVEVECLDSLNEVAIRVTDTGIGIPEDQQERIFGDFETIDSSYARQNSGSGLGLGIVKRLTELLGGEVGVESVVGDGSVFWFTLPLAVPDDYVEPSEDESEDATAAPEPLDVSLSVLLVEDNEINRTVARSLLESDGHSVIEAVDGEEGIAKAQSIPVDVILMDISMPGIDGQQATRTIRTNPGPNQDVPIIATTAHAMTEEITSFHAAGMTDVLIKPLSFDNMRAVLSRQFGKTCDVDMQPTAPEPMHLLDPVSMATLTEQLPDGTLADLLDQFGRDGDAFFKWWRTADSKTIDRPTLVAEAHKLAGSAAVIGAVALRTQLNALEVGMDDMDAAELTRVRDALVLCWQETVQELGLGEEIGAA